MSGIFNPLDPLYGKLFSGLPPALIEQIKQNTEYLKTVVGPEIVKLLQELEKTAQAVLALKQLPYGDYGI